MDKYIETITLKICHWHQEERISPTGQRWCPWP